VNTPWRAADLRALRLLREEFDLDFEEIAGYFLLDRLEDDCRERFELISSAPQNAIVAIDEPESSSGPAALEIQGFHDSIIDSLPQPLWLKERLRRTLNRTGWTTKLKPVASYGP
jgi:hypothetical protein